MMIGRMSGSADAEALKVLASVVQPPQGYAREELREYNTLSPLNRLVDAIPPESQTARKFNQLATLIADGKASSQQWKDAQNWLVLWRDNDAKLQPQLQASELTAELGPLSQSVSQVAAIGLQALDDLKNHHAESADQIARNLQLLSAAEKPGAVLVDKLVPSIELLVKASGK
jgi:hexosaminidase